MPFGTKNPFESIDPLLVRFDSYDVCPICGAELHVKDDLVPVAKIYFPDAPDSTRTSCVFGCARCYRLQKRLNVSSHLALSDVIHDPNSKIKRRQRRTQVELQGTTQVDHRAEIEFLLSLQLKIASRLRTLGYTDQIPEDRAKDIVPGAWLDDDVMGGMTPEQIEAMDLAILNAEQRTKTVIEEDRTYD